MPKQNLNKKSLNDIKTRELESLEKKSKKSLKNRFSDKQKLILASIATIIVTTGLFFLSLAIQIQDGKVTFQMPFSGGALEYVEDDSQRREVEIAIAELESQISRTNPEDLLVERVRFEDLNIYPTAWVERHFTPEERRNTLISGPNADPDGDGLVNRLEYMYSSDPKNAYSLCGEKTDKKPNCNKTDKQNIENGISPLTGLKIQPVGNIIITRQDRIMAEELSDSMINASQAGVDFPEVYQLSSTVDFAEEMNKIKFSTIPDDRNNLLKYMELRTNFLKEFSEAGAIFSFSEIYKLVDRNALQILQKNYQDLYNNFKSAPVPKSQAEFQRGVLFSLQTAIELIDVRIATLSGEINDTEEQIKKNREKSIQLVWGFRQLAELLQEEG